MERLITFCGRHARIIIVLWCVVAVISGVAASRLRLNSDLERLLPPDAESVQQLERLEGAYGQQLDRLTLLVEGQDAESNLEVVQELASSVEPLPHIKSVEYRRPTEFFLKHRLMYMETVDAREISEKLSKRLKWERKQANPLFVGLGNEKPPEIDFSSIEQKYRDQVGSEEFITNEDRTGFVVTVELDYPSDHIDVTQEFVRDHLEPVVSKVGAAHEGVTITKTGRYIKRLEQRDATAKDLGRGTSLAFALIVIFLVGYFRSIKAPALVTVPLILGTICTFGATWLAFGTLNILTGFVGSVLLGLGIDYGIHLAARFRDERKGRSAEEALVKAFASSGKASLYAGLTTVAALGSLALSSFQAFHEFGLLSLIGMSFMGAAYATLFPALVLSVEGTRFAMGDGADADHEEQRWTEAVLGRYKVISAVVLAVSLAAGAYGIQHLGFEWDFHKLMPADLPAHMADKRLEALGVGRVPGVILVEDRAHAEAVAQELEKRKAAGGDGLMIDRSLSVYDLLPSEQEQKLEIWKGLREEFEKIPSKVFKEKKELADIREEVYRITDEGELSLGDLPGSLTGRFARKDDPEKWIMLVLPTRIIHDARDAIAYSRVTSDLPTSGAETNVDAIGEEAIMRDIVHDLERDTRWMLLLTLFSIFVVAVVAFRKVRGVLILFGNIGVGFLVAMGLAGVLGIKFNFINIIILPIWLGLGVDAAFHMMTRVDEAPSDQYGFWHTVRAVGAAFGTTMIGFGGLMISSHRGLASLGKIAVVGLVAILVLSVAMQLLLMRKSDVFKS